MPFLVGIIILVAVIVLFIIIFIALYNSIVSLRNKVENAWHQIDVQLRKRYDLIPNLVETVKGYATHEKKRCRMSLKQGILGSKQKMSRIRLKRRI